MSNENRSTWEELTQEKPQKSKKGKTPKEPVPFTRVLREWSDALIIAFVVAMFIRTFVVELFKIPSGSMSPTLLGDYVAEGEATGPDNQKKDYLLIRSRTDNSVQVFSREKGGNHYNFENKMDLRHLSSSQQFLIENNLKLEEHKILVNKFAYWFSTPSRGDIAIFRVPFKSLKGPEPYEIDGVPFMMYPYNRAQNTYVKRILGLPGEELSIHDDHVYINGEIPTKPDILAENRYFAPEQFNNPYFTLTVPKNEVFVMGDNSGNSLDSRYWGPLPEQNLRGRAVLRILPLGKFGLLTH